MAQRWLTSASPISVAPYIIHSPDIVAIWDHLPEVVRENKQAMRMPYDEDASDPSTAAALSRHYAGLAALAMALGGEVVNRVKIPAGATQLLDVGGSHAAYSVLFCRKYPALRARSTAATRPFHRMRCARPTANRLRAAPCGRD